MQIIKMETVSGDVIEQYLPETEEDVEALRKRAKTGEINDAQQLNDRPSRPPKKGA